MLQPLGFDVFLSFPIELGKLDKLLPVTLDPRPDSDCFAIYLQIPRLGCTLAITVGMLLVGAGQFAFM